LQGTDSSATPAVAVDGRRAESGCEPRFKVDDGSVGVPENVLDDRLNIIVEVVETAVRQVDHRTRAHHVSTPQFQDAGESTENERPDQLVGRTDQVSALWRRRRGDPVSKDAPARIGSDNLDVVMAQGARARLKYGIEASDRGEAAPAARR